MLEGVQSVRKTVVPAVPALAVPLNQVWLRAVKTRFNVRIGPLNWLLSNATRFDTHNSVYVGSP